jgi:GDPmannose 4,6-dehydratase
MSSQRGEAHSVREFVERPFAHVDRTIEWRGRGVDEVGIDQDRQVLVKIDPRYFRPTEVESLCGDASKAHQRLGWRPTIEFADLVREMVEEDLRAVETIKTFVMSERRPLYSLKGKRVWVAGHTGMVGSA